LQWSQAEGMLDCVIAKFFCEFLILALTIHV
jgi:hypothetical protein